MPHVVLWVGPTMAGWNPVTLDGGGGLIHRCRCWWAEIRESFQMILRSANDNCRSTPRNRRRPIASAVPIDMTRYGVLPRDARHSLEADSPNSRAIP
jgi:hypothetical protein